MSLSKQLLALLLAIFAVIYSVNLLISINNIRDYLEIESEIHAQDTATSLGLALSPHLKNDKDPIVSTMMTAIFDRGYYQAIKLQDANEKEWLYLTHSQQNGIVPAWFKRLIPMKTATAKTEINSGWTIAGYLYVTIDPGNSYLKLYNQAKKSGLYSLITFILAFALLSFVLRLTLLPLKKIESLASQIGNGDYNTIKKLPWTTEVKNVALAMNDMSQKIARVFNSLQNKLEKANATIQFDSLTGLNNSALFTTQLKQLLSQHLEGHVLLIKIDHLGDLANQLGSEKTDQFLIDFAEMLNAFCTKNEQLSSYRLYGAEFALIFKNSDIKSVEILANALKQSFTEFGQNNQIQDVAHIGITGFDRLSSTKKILASAHEALEQAKQIGTNCAVVQQTTDQARDLLTWKNLVTGVIAEKRYEVMYINQALNLTKSQNNSIVMEEAFTRVKDENQRYLATGTFISIAEKYDKVIELDQGVTARVIKYISYNDITYPVTVNLSMTTVQSGYFRSWLSNVLKSQNAVARQLAFSLSAYSVATQIPVFIEFINYIHSLGAKVILKRYEPQLLSLDDLKKLKLDYLRLAKDLTTDINHYSEKTALISAIQELGILLDFKVLAENVSSEDDYVCLKNIGIYGANRQP